MSKVEDTTFVKITNKTIYDKITSIESKLDCSLSEVNEKMRVHDGRITLAKWMAATALTIALIALGYLVSHLAK